MTVLEFAQKSGYDNVKKASSKWRGYTVYIPGFDDGKIHYIGKPLVVLVKNGKVRWSSAKESIEYLRESTEQ